MLDPKKYLELLIEEYRSIRDEVKQSNINMWTAMQWGTAILAILFGVGLSQWNSGTPASPIVFGLLIPAFSFITLSFWLGEAARLKRAGDYIFLLEKKAEVLLQSSGSLPEVMRRKWPKKQDEYERWLHLKRSVDNVERTALLSAPLAWETWLRVRKGRGLVDGHLSKLYMFRVGYFPMVSTGSLVLAEIWATETTAPVSYAVLKFSWMFGWLAWAACLMLAIAVSRDLNRTAGEISAVRGAQWSPFRWSIFYQTSPPAGVDDDDPSAAKMTVGRESEMPDNPPTGVTVPPGVTPDCPPPPESDEEPSGAKRRHPFA